MENIARGFRSPQPEERAMFRRALLVVVLGLVASSGGLHRLEAHPKETSPKPKPERPAVTRPRQPDRLPPPAKRTSPPKRVYGPAEPNNAASNRQPEAWKPSIYYGPSRYPYYRYVYPRYYGYSPYIRRFYYYGPVWYYGPYWGPGYYVPPAVFHRAWYYPPVIHHWDHHHWHHDGFHHGGFHHGGWHHGGFHGHLHLHFGHH